MNLTAIKDILVVCAPIIVAFISYRSNKKTQRDIKLETERMAKEKEAETKQLVDKMRAELESQKQLISWQNSMPQANEYTQLIDTKRFGNVTALPKLCQDITAILLSGSPSLEVLYELNTMLDRIELPKNDEELFPHEVPIIMQYQITRKAINAAITDMLSKEEQKKM